MTLILEVNQTCPYSISCPYNENNTCMGAVQNRINSFSCDYVQNGVFVENGQQRNILDQTGNMKIIME